MVALTVNLLVVTITALDEGLHTLMYFFLRKLSNLELCYISITIPKSVGISLTGRKYISLLGCVSQFFLVALFAASELSVLTALSYDRYATILYTPPSTFCLRFCGSTIVQHIFCDVPSLLPKISCYKKHVVIDMSVTGGVALVCVYSSTWKSFTGAEYFIHTVISYDRYAAICVHLRYEFFCDVLSLIRITCSDGHVALDMSVITGVVLGFVCFILITISYIYCDVPALLMISCSEDQVATELSMITVVALAVVCFLPIVTSYICIFWAVLRMTATEGRTKAWRSRSTCVLLPPALKLLIYRLKNKDVKSALKAPNVDELSKSGRKAAKIKVGWTIQFRGGILA
ncbi:olfactory receptor 14A16-like [Tachyglossus aculeatus]|uniref:olfactory receptor 14A16-like n=1 Tax=Tachyglossus aculeatus TaxID=9261 RepID=UPI0018F2F874|nr:olfactory receptor 14A16-like [Tachyglossus aculeatus]